MLQIKIAAFFVLFQPGFVRIVIAGLAAVNALVSEHAQDGALQNHAKKTELTLRFIERKGEKVAAGGAPVSRIKKGGQRVVDGGEKGRFFLKFLLDAPVFGGIVNHGRRSGGIFALQQKSDGTGEQQKQDCDCETVP